MEFPLLSDEGLDAPLVAPGPSDPVVENKLVPFDLADMEFPETPLPLLPSDKCVDAPTVVNQPASFDLAEVELSEGLSGEGVDAPLVSLGLSNPVVVNESTLYDLADMELFESPFPPLPSDECVDAPPVTLSPSNSTVVNEHAPFDLADMEFSESPLPPLRSDECVDAPLVILSPSNSPAVNQPMPFDFADFTMAESPLPPSDQPEASVSAEVYSVSDFETYWQLDWEPGLPYVIPSESPSPMTMFDALGDLNPHDVFLRFHKPGVCVLCLYVAGHTSTHEACGQAPVIRSCPFYSLGPAFDTFEQGLREATLRCVAEHRVFVTDQSYSYCSHCLIDKCRCSPVHPPFSHADEQCPSKLDANERDWYVCLLYLAFRQSSVRAQIAPQFTRPESLPGLGTDLVTVRAWGEWAAYISAEGMRRGTIVAALSMTSSC